jgi:GntR family transcriptional regulator
MIDLTRMRGHPVYLQIKEQLERRIASGALAPGQPLPSVRAMAEQLSINPNTVVRAYRELEAEGLVETRHGEGTFVSRTVRKEQPAVRLLGEHARRYARAARELGATLSEAQSALDGAWNEEADNE